MKAFGDWLRRLRSQSANCEATTVGVIEPYIRHYRAADLSKLLEIENECFRDPWSEEEFKRLLLQRNGFIRVVERSLGREIIGFIAYRIFKTRVEIDSVAVAAKYRRLGIGTRLIRELEAKHHSRRDVCECLVSEWNLEAHQFLAAVGFRGVSVARECFVSSRAEVQFEDGYLFELNMDRSIQSKERRRAGV